IFTQMNWVCLTLLIAGFIFLVIEVFLPGFGFFGIMGGVMVAAGIIVRFVQGLTTMQGLVLMLMVLGFFILCFIIMVISAKYGILGHTGLFENNTTLDASYNRTPRELRKLIGKSGKTVSVLNLAGKAKIRGKIYEVESINSYIEADKHIKVVEIRDNTIMVRKWFE
ncbi:MAG: hypothetical protein MJ149_02140, partial [Clostridia bacterium]|nr:hypothetical protein [Clostridia bacterium]